MYNRLRNHASTNRNPDDIETMHRRVDMPWGVDLLGNLPGCVC